jgi:hypothetical protein
MRGAGPSVEGQAGPCRGVGFTQGGKTGERGRTRSCQGCGLLGGLALAKREEETAEEGFECRSDMV